MKVVLNIKDIHKDKNRKSSTNETSITYVMRDKSRPRGSETDRTTESNARDSRTRDGESSAKRGERRHDDSHLPPMPVGPNWSNETSSSSSDKCDKDGDSSESETQGNENATEYSGSRMQPRRSALPAKDLDARRLSKDDAFARPRNGGRGKGDPRSVDEARKNLLSLAGSRRDARRDARDDDSSDDDESTKVPAWTETGQTETDEPSDAPTHKTDSEKPRKKMSDRDVDEAYERLGRLAIRHGGDHGRHRVSSRGECRKSKERVSDKARGLGAKLLHVKQRAKKSVKRLSRRLSDKVVDAATRTKRSFQERRSRRIQRKSRKHEILAEARENDENPRDSLRIFKAELKKERHDRRSSRRRERRSRRSSIREERWSKKDQDRAEKDRRREERDLRRKNRDPSEKRSFLNRIMGRDDSE